VIRLGPFTLDRRFATLRTVAAAHTLAVRGWRHWLQLDHHRTSATLLRSAGPFVYLRVRRDLP